MKDKLKNNKNKIIRTHYIKHKFILLNILIIIIKRLHRK